MCQIQTILIFLNTIFGLFEDSLGLVFRREKRLWRFEFRVCENFCAKIFKILRFEIWKINCEQHYKGLTQTHTRHIIHYSVQNCCLTNFGHCYFLLLLMNCLFKQDRWWFVGLKQTFGSSWRFPHNMGSWESYLQSLTILFSWTRSVQILGGRP